MAKAQAVVGVSKRVKRVYPLPEAIPAGKGAATQPERWVIRESGSSVPRTEIERGAMAVPLGDDAVSECVRAHETAHARWSPSRPPAGLAWDVVQAVEDARIHSLLKSSGVDMSAGLVDPVELKASYAKHFTGLPDGTADRRMLTLMHLAAVGTGSEFVTRVVLGERTTTADEAAAMDAYRIAMQAHGMLHEVRKRPRFEDTRRVAEWLEAMLATAEKKAERTSERERKRDEGRESDERMTAEERAQVSKPGEGLRTRRAGETAVPWGEMRVERVPLPRPLPPRMGHKRVRPVAEGDLPRRLERWCVDKAVFTASKRMRRGTVVIDQSGSMSMTGEEVDRVLQVAPAARIAGYSGSGGQGVLRVIADRGKRCADAHLLTKHGGNVVDGPALRWLAKQPAPRIWVCDGGVTGVGDQQAGNLLVDAGRICRAAGIVRVPTMELAIKLMGEHART